MTASAAHEAQPDPQYPDHPRCLECGKWIRRDLDGAWEHADAGIAVPAWIQAEAERVAQDLNDGPLAGTGLTAEWDLSMLPPPRAEATITAADLPRLWPCDKPVPHAPHRRELRERDLIGGYRCDGNGGIVTGFTVEDHFHGCPTTAPDVAPWECDYCIQRSASMSGEG